MARLDIAAAAAHDRPAGRGVLINHGGDIAAVTEPPEGGGPVLITDDSATPHGRARDPT